VIFGEVRVGTNKAYDHFPAVAVQEVFRLSIFGQSYQHHTGGSFLARRLSGFTWGASDQFMNQHLLVKMPERRTVQIKAPIAGNSKAIAKIGNVELAHFNKQMLIHELIRGSLDRSYVIVACYDSFRSDTRRCWSAASLSGQDG
jgi:hypothetical protein